MLPFERHAVAHSGPSAKPKPVAHANDAHGKALNLRRETCQQRATFARALGIAPIAGAVGHRMRWRQTRKRNTRDNSGQLLAPGEAKSRDHRPRSLRDARLAARSRLGASAACVSRSRTSSGAPPVRRSARSSCKVHEGLRHDHFRDHRNRIDAGVPEVRDVVARFLNREGEYGGLRLQATERSDH